MIFYPKSKRVPDNVVFHLIIMILVHLIFLNLFIPLKESLTSKIPAFKILGVYSDENLSFDYHFKHLYSKISKSLIYLNNANYFLPTVALKSLYYEISLFSLAWTCPIHPSLLFDLNLSYITFQSFQIFQQLFCCQPLVFRFFRTFLLFTAGLKIFQQLFYFQPLV